MPHIILCLNDYYQNHSFTFLNIFIRIDKIDSTVEVKIVIYNNV